MGKDRRINIRIGEELDAWLSEDAARRGLDTASYARMILYERMNSVGAPMMVAPAGLADESVAPGEVVYERHAMAEGAESTEAADVDAVVAARLQEAEASGGAAPLPREATDADRLPNVRPLNRNGGLPPVVRVLAPGDVNGPGASPMWTWLKVASGDTSDTGDNFGKFLVSRDGREAGRFCAPLRPALLVRALLVLAHRCQSQTSLT
jgi:hypothetical protein